MEKVLISAINYRCSKEAIELIKSLKNLNYKDFDILILDNSETDDYKPIKKAYPKVKLLINKNIGVSGGINQALDYAEKNKFDCLLMLDADVELDKNCLKEMISVLNLNPESAIIGAKSYYFNEKNILQDVSRIYHPYKGSLSRDIGGEDKGQFENIKEVDYVWGGCLLFDLEKMKKIGRLDERYFLFYDTMDIQFRAKQLGYKTLYAPKSKLWHKVSRSQGGTSKIFDYYSVRNRLLIVKKFNTKFQKLIFYIYFYILVFPFRTLKHLIKGKFSTIKWNFIGLFDAVSNKWGRKDFN